jgi:hypothetical protein
MVESCCWFGFVFLVCSTPLRAFGCASHLIPPIQQQSDLLYSSVCPASGLVLIICVTSPRGCKTYFWAFHSLLQPRHTFTMKFSSSLLHPISHPSRYHTFKTLTQRWFGKMAITFWNKLEIGQIVFLKLGKKRFYIRFFPPKVSSKKLDCPNLASKCLYSNSCPALIFVLNLCDFLPDTHSI